MNLTGAITAMHQNKKKTSLIPEGQLSDVTAAHLQNQDYLIWEIYF